MARHCYIVISSEARQRFSISINRSNRFFSDGEHALIRMYGRRRRRGNYCTSPCPELEHSTGSMTISPAPAGEASWTAIHVATGGEFSTLSGLSRICCRETVESPSTHEFRRCLEISKTDCSPTEFASSKQINNPNTGLVINRRFHWCRWKRQCKI